jgi:hypothetical protein
MLKTSLRAMCSKPLEVLHVGGNNLLQSSLDGVNRPEELATSHSDSSGEALSEP